ncbi:bifunctional demethylmenaquinone methyltransferase/2-methoxy-6-polyprenyl-1,4-benzoquinol methylase UbiE [Iocasia frigidifontis]|uniref:Demethylmenaquinone methyltransferase n=1 Tax=Iocasia fonsfrigidae TaxID=2682810 RepID=A0A8A7KD95_9FIRM|nr:bifunctional demethylmenaquinone methyltransferase/2-methoxy-6-polyprenyl-1,4-benzoquinol methylase UbiE [Iocasia fonsfrigidae]QTL97578.1 bifunctional demethylmenaquinone methyltransferase/2-methoxy-6-polyprenyl-1,4-benzoquinol methylase UbiE [Iocasia fonsfrigidae]
MKKKEKTRDRCLIKNSSKENKEKIVLDIFNSAVHKYDLMNTLMTMGLDRYWRKLVVNYSGIRSGDKGLDLCCGTGILTIELAHAVGSSGTIIGIDFAANMLALARKRTHSNNLEQVIKLINGNVLNIPFQENTFDCATVAWGLRNVSDLQLAIQEMRRVVKPGAKVISLDMAHPEIPIFKDLYWYLFKIIIPPIAKIFSSYKKAYQYLYESARAFITQKQLAELFRSSGLINVKYHNLCGGIVAIVEGTKSLPHFPY